MFARFPFALVIGQVTSLRFHDESAFESYINSWDRTGEIPTNKCHHPLVLVEEDVKSDKCPIPEEIRASRFPSMRILGREGIRWNTCAIIGGSHTLIKCRLGSQIDKHDAVIRCNDNPVRGFETAVGSKTSVRLVNHQAKAIKDESIKIRIEVVENKSETVPMFINPYIEALAQRVAGLASPHEKKVRSCGGVAVMFALHSCQSVDIYGFGPETSGRHNGTYTHYFRSGEGIWAGHAMTAEQQWYHCLNGSLDQCETFSEILHIMGKRSGFTMQCS